MNSNESVWTWKINLDFKQPFITGNLIIFSSFILIYRELKIMNKENYINRLNKMTFVHIGKLMQFHGFFFVLVESFRVS